MSHPPYFPDVAATAALRAQFQAQPAGTALALRLRVELAWALRQRDTPAALELLDADADTAQTPRARLVYAEAAWLYNRNPEALALCDQALATFEAAEDACGCGDVHLMRATIRIEGGGDCAGASQQALACYQHAGDEPRTRLAEAWIACLDVMAQPEALRARWQTMLDRAREQPDPGIDAYLRSVQATLAWSRGEMAGAIADFSSAFDAAMASGQLRSAITLAENLGIACSSVNDHENALRWVQTARDLVQPTGWPFITAWTLMQTASVLVGLGRPAEAKTWLEQGLPLFAGHEGTRNHVLAQQVMGEACLALGEDATALAWLQAALAAARSLDQGDLIVSTQRQHALALARLQRLAEALAAAQDGLDVAQARGDTRRVALMHHTLACIARDQALPAPDGSPHANGCIHHLHAALETGQASAGFAAPPDWHQALAAAYEGAGQLQPALAHERAAAAAHQRLHTQRSDALLQTLLVRHQTEQARAEAAAQGLRAQLLEAQATLQRERAETMLAHAGKLVAMGRLVAGAVHEMGHPVGTMGLLAESLQAASGNWPPEAREAAGTLAGEARRLQRFVQRLRDFARAEPLHLVPHRLAQVLQDAQAIYRPRLVLERVQFTAPAGTALSGLWVLADAERLALVLANLAFNAADAMAGREVRTLQLGLQVQPDTVTLHLDDSGHGLSPEVMSRLFEPFFTTKPERQGLGLGLALSAEALGAMGGRLQGSNRPEGGARFSLSLQRTQAPAPGA